MSLRETLDDAADLALEGRRIDPVAVLGRAAERDAPAARLRRGTPWLLAATAAVVLLGLLAALLPWSAWGRVGPATVPSVGPTGLPTRLDAPAPWTPLVTERPIEAASVVFAGEVVHGVSSTGLGLFVLSADGRHYRRLPWTGDVSGLQPALSADGRWVAWTENARSGAGTERAVHLIRLRDGSRRDVRLTGDAEGLQYSHSVMVFLPGDDGQVAGLLVSGQVLDPANGTLTGRTWRIDLPAAAAAEVVCDCLQAVGLGVDGTVYRGDPQQAAPGLADLPVLPGAGQLGLRSGPWPVAVSPDGTAWAQGDGDQVLQIGRESGVTSLPQPRLSTPDVLGWGPRGVLVTWQVAGPAGIDGGRLLWYDPDRRTSTVIAELGAWAAERRPVVAAGLVAAGTQVPTALPEDVPWWSGEHRSYLVGRGLGLAAGLAVVLGSVWLVFRARRRFR